MQRSPPYMLGLASAVLGRCRERWAMNWDCGAERGSLDYILPGGYKLVVRIVEDGVCVGPVEGGAAISLPAEAVLWDAASGVLGGAVAGLLLAKPARSRGDLRQLLADAAAYMVAGELRVLTERLGLLAGHTLVADIGPLVARMARLARIHFWLRPVYNESLSTPEGHRWLRRLARESYADALVEPLTVIVGRLPEGSPVPGRLRGLARLASRVTRLSPVTALPGELLLRSLAERLHPLLRDPLLYFKLDAARLATRLLSFEEQLATIIGVKRILEKRLSPIRTASLVETSGYKPAVIKRYRSVAAAKWLVTAAASLQLPRPRLSASRRLQAEYHYNRLLYDLGFDVPEPILVDPRRLVAAYSYVEGSSLAELLGENPLHPVYMEYASILARLHSSGVGLWDTNPTNVIASRNRLYLVDLEQARENPGLQEKAMDIAVAVYYSIPYSPSRVAERASFFAKGYIRAGGDPAVVEEAARYRYAAPFMAMAPPPLVERARRGLARAAEEAREPSR